MRITENLIATQVLGAITDSLDRLGKVQEQLATARRINRPSDDPLGSNLVLRFRAASAGLEEYERAIDASQEFLRATGTALEQTAAILQRTREIGLRGGSDVISGSRRPLASEVNQLLEELMNQVNTRFAGRYVFGGIQTDTPPFSVSRNAAGEITAVTANPRGIGGSVRAEVAEGVRIQSNLPGDQAFTSAVNVFGALMALRDALAAENTSGVVAATSSLDQGIAQVNDAAGMVGVTVQRLETVRARNRDDRTRIERLRSQIEDADMAELYLEMQKREQAFQASLAAGARALQSSLLDFLR
jgi:flagellar hook-associated protein 3 FlgL